jgi:hypothetical protein
MPVYEAHGVNDKCGLFPITIIEAASDGEAIRDAQCNRDLCRWIVRSSATKSRSSTLA